MRISTESRSKGASLSGATFVFSLEEFSLSVGICWVLSPLTGCLKTVILHIVHNDWVSGF